MTRAFCVRNTGPEMTGEKVDLERHILAVRLDNENVPVSYMSSLLRVVQAVLREVARSVEGPGSRFVQSPQPILVLSRLSTDGDLVLSFTFVDPLDYAPLEDLSDDTFAALLDRFAEFVRGLPQPSLWGGAAPRPSGRPYESELARRMAQLHRELRRSPRAILAHRTRTLEIEGDRMELS